ncbi:MAG: hypothetical protein COB66_02635 [Coxiella sp. (in: Bacteria)]|nr:MAG: hypothetical protein COB66_02635 [Coxiella sp. (in: g-proteobacteria)]
MSPSIPEALAPHVSRGIEKASTEIPSKKIVTPAKIPPAIIDPILLAQLQADVNNVLTKKAVQQTLLARVSEHAESVMDIADIASSIASLVIVIANTITAALGHPLSESIRVISTLISVICNYYDVGACSLLATKQQHQKDILHAIANATLAAVLMSGMTLYVIDTFTPILTGLLAAPGASIFVSVGTALTMLAKWTYECTEIDRANKLIRLAEDSIGEINQQLSEYDNDPEMSANLKEKKNNYNDYITAKKDQVKTHEEAARVWKYSFFAMAAIAVLGVAATVASAGIAPHALLILSGLICAGTTLYRVYANRKFENGQALPATKSIKKSCSKIYHALPSIFSVPPSTIAPELSTLATHIWLNG